MKSSLLTIARTAMAALFAAAVATASFAQPTVEPHTADAVRAADRAWTVAEEKGDVAYIDALLLPDYRSIAPDGTVHDKAAIVTSARKATPERAAMIEKYVAEHPTNMNVSIQGDTAVLTFTAKTDDAKRIRSCDVFVYVAGHWRALYSQHSMAERA